MLNKYLSKRNFEVSENKKNTESMSMEQAKSLFQNELEENIDEGLEHEEKIEISEQFIEKFPCEREEAIHIAFDNSPKEFVNALEVHKDNLTVNTSSGREGCYYFENGVYMRGDLSNDEYAEVMRHEISHYLDEQKGWCSEKIDYINAVYDDTMRINFSDSSTKELRAEMLDELFGGDMCYNRHVSDILSAVSRNDPRLIFRYNIEGVPYYRHKNKYFDKGHNKENEIYADVMACIGENDSETLEFLKKYFPNTYEETIKTLKEEYDE